MKNHDAPVMSHTARRPHPIALAAVALVAVVSILASTEPARAQSDILAPSYLVVSSGLTPDQATRLAAALGVPADPAAGAGGDFFYVDPARFMVLPMVPAAPIPGTQENEDQQEVTFEALNLDAVRAMAPPSSYSATLQVRQGLRSLGLMLPGGVPHASQVTLELFRPTGLRSMRRAIATNVSYSFVTPDGTPLVGPGASVQVSFDATGHPSLVAIATRTLSRGPDVPILSHDEALAACAAGFPAGTLVTADLVHYAPPLSVGVGAILPHYRCGGSLAQAGGPIAKMKSHYLPATRPGEVSGPPVVQVTAVMDGSTVNAQADVIGGTPPYTFLWTSSNTDIPPASFGPSISYDVLTRDPAAAPAESVHVSVIDSNGLIGGGGDSGSVAVPIGQPPLYPDPSNRTTGVEYQSWTVGLSGSEWTSKAFVLGTKAASPAVTNKFTAAELMSWERDFKDSGLPRGDDLNWVDNVDMVYYSGHGYPGGFTFSSLQDNWYINASASLRLGDADLEWLALDTCSFLNNDDNLVVSRTKNMFRGLHIVTGFHTTAADSYDLGGIFTDDMFGTASNPYSHSLGAHLTVVQAWALASILSNPPDGIWAAMGPTGPNGITNINDHFWGFGSVGPDIRGTDIKGFWRLSGST